MAAWLHAGTRWVSWEYGGSFLENRRKYSEIFPVGNPAFLAEMFLAEAGCGGQSFVRI